MFYIPGMPQSEPKPPPLFWRIHSAISWVFFALVMALMLLGPLLAAVFIAGLDPLFRAGAGVLAAVLAVIYLPIIIEMAWEMHRDYCKGW